MLFVIDI